MLCLCQVSLMLLTLALPAAHGFSSMLLRSGALRLRFPGALRLAGCTSISSFPCWLLPPCPRSRVAAHWLLVTRRAAADAAARSRPGMAPWEASASAGCAEAACSKRRARRGETCASAGIPSLSPGVAMCAHEWPFTAVLHGSDMPCQPHGMHCRFQSFHRHQQHRSPVPAHGHTLAPSTHAPRTFTTG